MYGVYLGLFLESNPVFPSVTFFWWDIEEGTEGEFKLMPRRLPDSCVSQIPAGWPSSIGTPSLPGRKDIWPPKALITGFNIPMDRQLLDGD